MTELLEQLPLSFDTAPVEKVEVENTKSYSENGIIFRNLIDSLRSLQSSREAFCGFLQQAIINKIWLGFVNPVNGKFVSFIHKSPSTGEINESVSFKLWVSSNPKKGGLGFTSLDDLEHLIKYSRDTSELALPLMLDNFSVGQVNELRKAQGEPLLTRIAPSKQHYLKKCIEAPKEFSLLKYERKLPVELVARCVTSYEKIEIAEEKESAILEVRRLLDKYEDKKELEERLAELFKISLRKMISLDPNDCEQMARNLINAIKDKEKIKELAEQLLSEIELIEAVDDEKC